jgi:hypothetical protein
MLGWIAKSSRQMWRNHNFFACIYGICQSLVSKITAILGEPSLGLESIQPKALEKRDLRHTFGVRYLERNPGDLRGLAAFLGHSSLNTVMLYTALTLDELARRMGDGL